MSRIIRYAAIILAITFVLSLGTSGHACTIWASAGSAVDGGGAIIGKNRDNVSSLYSRLGMVYPAKGWRFLGIHDIEADGYVVAAINEKGLVVVNASANSVPRKKRRVATEDVTERLLVSFDSVESVLKEKELFRKTHPAIYIIADASRIMSVEVAPGGQVSVSVKETGTLALTNHFTGDDVLHANETMSRESLLRLRRISDLCSRNGRPHTMDDFVTMSRDENNGLPGAVMRKPRSGTSIRTLATWVIRLREGRSPELYVHLMNPGQPDTVYRANLDGRFWNPVSGIAGPEVRAGIARDN